MALPLFSNVFSFCVYWLETMNQMFPIKPRVFLHVQIWWLKKKILGLMVNYVLSPQSSGTLIVPIKSTNNILLIFWHRQNLRLKVTMWSSSFISNSINSNHMYFNFKGHHWKGQMSLHFFSDYFFLGAFKSHILMHFYLFTYFWTPSDWFIITNGVVPTHTFTCS